jgi:hypothetical protein
MRQRTKLNLLVLASLAMMLTTVYFIAFSTLKFELSVDQPLDTVSIWRKFYLSLILC